MLELFFFQKRLVDSVRPRLVCVKKSGAIITFVIASVIASVIAFATAFATAFMAAWMLFVKPRANFFLHALLHTQC
jgi:hypothetical protein